ncbi:MAG: hypothetical protein JO277_04640, partial [Candidatus Eremiobacteraeota bacterium]|nr:hypothetical protein [Candidatus Eremiobacteraeota bacterium]
MRVFISAFIVALLAAAVAGAGGRAAVLFPAPPPLPKPSPVSETFFGVTVSDPYRYFENMQNPATVAFFKDQNAYTRAVLDRLGAPREKLFERIKQLDNAGTSVTGVNRVGSYFFYEKLRPGENSEKLYVSNSDGSGERLLVDPDKLATAGKHYTINYFQPSWDGKY